VSDAFHIQNGLKPGNGLSPLLFNFGLEYAIRKVQENQEELEVSGAYQFLVSLDNINMLGKNTSIIRMQKPC
jgi:hypothetical protein